MANVPDRANDPRRGLNRELKVTPAMNKQQEIDSMVSQIRAKRKLKAAPGSPESRGYWTDNSGLH
jgi:hypothetical protein